MLRLISGVIIIISNVINYFLLKFIFISNLLHARAYEMITITHISLKSGKKGKMFVKYKVNTLWAIVAPRTTTLRWASRRCSVRGIVQGVRTPMTNVSAPYVSESDSKHYIRSE